MPEKYCSDEEKARILAWMQEYVPIKIICECTGIAKSTILKLIAIARRLPPNVVPKDKFCVGRQGKTSDSTDNLIRK
jgi:hypothetical protein